ncbi:MAG: ParA family protein [Anaerocolumna sp.]
MKVIAVMNPKGGIGKTITASSIGYILGEEHKRKTLIVEGDQQGNISKLFGRYEPEGIGMSELLERHWAAGGDYSTNDLIKTTLYENIDIIPANGYLMRTNMNLLLEQEENQINRFKDAIEEISGVYDYVICDCGLTLDMTVTNILVAADLVIAPVKLGGFEVDALDNIIEQIEDLKQFNPNLDIKMLMTMKQKNKTTLEAEEWLKNNHNAYKYSIRRSVVVEKSTYVFMPLPKFSKNGIVTQDYREVVAELLQDTEG